MSNIKLFSTPTIEGVEIESYIGLVTANQVSGTGFFTDFTAGLSDFFGGKSGAYRRAMDELYDDIIRQISDKATRMGGNAIVGVTIDYDNISAKAMSMFMISMQGTVVKIKEGTPYAKQLSSDLVSMESLERACQLKLLSSILQENTRPSENQWKTILSNKMTELAPDLFKIYTKLTFLDSGGVGVLEIGKNFVENFNLFASLLDYDTACSLFYSSEKSQSLIIDLNLFNAKEILKLAKSGNLNFAVSLLKADKPSYSRDDLKDMQELANYLNNLPDVGRIEEVSGMFGSKTTKFICVCGQKNDTQYTYCNSCYKNIKGLTQQQETAIKKYTNKVETLAEIFQS